MSVGLIALFDDIAALAKVAAASLDDIAGQAAKAGTKAAGVVIDDAAVTPRYVTGFSAARELPIIGKIALGSLKNKLLILLPAALILSLVAPQAITPLLMIGGLFLCYEGVERFTHSCYRMQRTPMNRHSRLRASMHNRSKTRRLRVRSRRISSCRPKSWRLRSVRCRQAA